MLLIDLNTLLDIASGLAATSFFVAHLFDRL